MARSRPRVILSAAVSVDGKIATVQGDAGLSSRADKRRVHLLRSRADAIMIGKNTLELDDPLLTARLAGGRNPVRVILDSRGTISSGSKILRTSGSVPTIIAVTKSISEDDMLRLRRSPAEVVVHGTEEVDIRALLADLHTRGIRLLLVEGGGIINWYFVKHGLADEVIVTVAPYLVGGQSAASLIRGAGFPSIADSARLRLRSVSRFKDEVVLEYAIRQKRAA